MKLLTLSACLLVSIFSSASPYNPIGNWMGTLEAGATRLRVVFHIKANGAGLQATMDSPDQGARDIPITEARASGDSIFLEVGPISYKGRLSSDTIIEGVFKQGISIPLMLHRGEAVAKIRPQTPRPPFPYRSEDVSYTNADKTIIYGATITSPKDGGKHPAILLLTGSGQQNRDEEIMEHKPFAVIADYLTRRGFVVMRVDDRGTGITTGDLSKATTVDFAKDAATSLDYLRQQSQVDTKKIGLLGHSEGGMIAEMLAAARKDIAFIISMAGPGIPTMQLMAKQNDAILQKKGLSPEARKAYLQLYRSIMQTTAKYEDRQALNGAVEEEVQKWQKTTPGDIVMQTTGINNETTLKEFAAAFSNQLSIPWFRYFISYDPAPVISRVSAMVLAINGSEDIQVDAKENLAGWRAALKHGKSGKYEVKELPGLNHLFQQCKSCTAEEYGDLEQTISPEALALIGNWLKKEVQ